MSNFFTILLLGVPFLNLSQVSSQNLTAVQCKSKLFQGLGGHSTVYDGKDHIYIFGGAQSGGHTSEILSYSIISDEITLITHFNSSAAYAAGLLDINKGVIYHIGGSRSQDIHKFTPESNELEELVKLPKVKFNPTAVLHNSKILIIGGDGNDEQVAVLEFDPETLNSTPVHEMNFTMFNPKAIWDAVEENVIIIGGSKRSNNNTATAAKYTPRNNESIRLSLDLPRVSGLFSLVKVGKYGYIIGGISSGIGYDGQIVQLDTENFETKFLQVENFPLVDATFGSTGTVYVEKLNRIYLFGGAVYKNYEVEFTDGIWYIELPPLNTENNSTTATHSSLNSTTLTTTFDQNTTNPTNSTAPIPAPDPNTTKTTNPTASSPAADHNTTTTSSPAAKPDTTETRNSEASSTTSDPDTTKNTNSTMSTTASDSDTTKTTNSKTSSPAADTDTTKTMLAAKSTATFGPNTKTTALSPSNSMSNNTFDPRTTRTHISSNSTMLTTTYNPKTKTTTNSTIANTTLEPNTATITLTPSNSIPSTTVDPSIFDCTTKPDGMYPHRYNCRQFIGCRNGLATEYNCPDPLLFDPGTKSCDFPDLVVCETHCKDKPNGMSPHPNDCSMFIGCRNGVLNIYKCPAPLLFDPVSGRCSYPEDVQCHSESKLELLYKLHDVRTQRRPI